MTMKAVDYALLDELLADESLSFRQCAERAGCSDWSVRRRYRELSGDDRTMKTSRRRYYINERQTIEPPVPLTTTEAVTAWSVIALFVVGFIALGRYARRNDVPPYDPEAPMP